jgi:hypothetical protein
MKAETYATQLRRTVGHERSLKIAARCVQGASPSNWSSLPAGNIFYTKDKRGNTDINRSHLTHLFNWWTHVYNILKKVK